MNLIQDQPDPWMDVAKWAINCFVANRMAGTAYPKPSTFPDGIKCNRLLFGGANEFCRKLRHQAFNRHNQDRHNDRAYMIWMSFLTSLAQGVKGACPRPGPDRIETSVIETIKALFSDPVYTEPTESPEQFVPDYKVVGDLSSFLKDDFCQTVPVRIDPTDKPWHSYIPFLRGKSWNRSAGIRVLKGEIARRVKELFGKRKVDFSTYMANDAAFFPSTSANYVSTRDGGGSVSAILNHPLLSKLLQTPRLLSRFYHMRRLFYSEFKTQPLFGLPEALVDHISSYLNIDYYREICGKIFDCSLRGVLNMRPYNLTKPDELESTEKGLLIDDRVIRQTVSHVTEVARNLALLEPNMISPVGLAESLKVRVITKSPPLRTFALKPLQNYLHKVLRHNRCFRLIGETVSDKYISEVLSGFIRFLSGDYKSATDNLVSELSEFCGYQISKALGFEDTTLEKQFIDALVNHLISPDDYWACTGLFIEEPLEQKNGQLMGSVVSFPILCIINAALCGLCVEEGLYCKKSLKDLPLIVNGDDCAFPSSDLIHSMWKYLGHCAGLTPSAGKYYDTDRFVQINSRNFIPVDLHMKRQRLAYIDELAEYAEGDQYFSYFEEVPFVNLRLLIGYPRSTAVEVPEDFKITSLGSRQRDFLLDGPMWLFSQLSVLFYARNEELIKSSKLPWFVPTKYGGLGLNSRLTPFGDDISEIDRAVCALISKSSSFKSGKGRVLLPRNIKVEDDWKTHLLVMDLINVNGLKPVEVDSPCESFSTLYSTLCLGVLNFENLCDINPTIQYALSAKDMSQYRVYEYLYRIRRARRFWAVAHYHPGVQNRKNREFSPFGTRYLSIGKIMKECDLHLLEKENLKSYNCKFEELTSLLCQVDL